MEVARFRGGERNGPGLLFILVVLVVVAVLGAKYFGFAPGGRQVRPVPPKDAQEKAAPEPALPVVVIYHSHTTENYSPGDSHTRGEPGQIVEVGAELGRALEAKGIKTIHITEIHDYPKYSESYPNSLKSLRQVLDTGVVVGAVLDIHRDGLPPRPPGFTTVKVKDVEAAKILFVVGDENNPYMEQNLAFAEQLRDLVEDMYPGLSRGIKVQHAMLNGYAHPQSATVFIGDYRGNTLAEAKNAAALLAEVAAAYIRGVAGVPANGI